MFSRNPDSKSYLGHTVSDVCGFVASFLPLHPKDIPFVYYGPRRFGPKDPKAREVYLKLQREDTTKQNKRLKEYEDLRKLEKPQPFQERILQFGVRVLPSDPTLSVSRVILAVSPTPGFYEAMSDMRFIPDGLAFLHRPWDLDKKRVPKGTFIIASHTGFDEALTVGYNTALASRLGIDLDTSVCLKGYKNDTDRRIGIVGLLDPSQEPKKLLSAVNDEFGEHGSDHGFSGGESTGTKRMDNIKVVAIMNAFRPEEVDRVMEAAVSNKWVSDNDDGSQILFLTGQAREEGLNAALDKKMKVVCVGHRTCEEWGIRYLAQQIKEQYDIMEVVEIYEAGEPPTPKKRKQVEDRDLPC